MMIELDMVESFVAVQILAQSDASDNTFLKLEITLREQLGRRV